MAKINSHLYHSKKGLLFEIRSVEGRDAVLLTDFQNKIAKETQNTLRYIGQPPVDVKKIEQDWNDCLLDPNQVKIGAFKDGILVGFALCRKPHGDHPWMRHLGYFAMMIVQECWGQGLGKKLLESLDDYAKQSGITKMEATVRTNNPRAIELYKKCGYQMEGTRQKSAKIDSNYLDEYFIAKFY